MIPVAHLTWIIWIIVYSSFITFHFNFLFNFLKIKKINGNGDGFQIIFIYPGGFYRDIFRRNDKHFISGHFVDYSSPPNSIGDPHSSNNISNLPISVFALVQTSFDQILV